MAADRSDVLLCRSKEIPDRFPHLFTPRQWEWAVRNRRTNGFDRALRRVGNRFFVSIPEFVRVINEAHPD
jgi:hypothetical protein